MCYRKRDPAFKLVPKDWSRKKNKSQKKDLIVLSSPLTLEHVCSILGSMLRNLKGQQRSRLLSKFTENDCEKVSDFY